MKFIYRTTKGYRWQLFLLLVTVLLGTVTGSMFPYITGKIVDQIFYKQQMRGFLLYFFLYAGLYFLNQCSHGALNYLWAHLEATYVVDIRKLCFRHLLKLKASVLTNIKSGDVMNRILNDTECFLEFIHRSLFYVLANFLQLAISIGYLLYINLYLGLVAIVLTPVMAWSIRYFSGILKKRHEKIQTEKGLVDAWILEMMIGISQWKLLHAQNKVERDYRAKNNLVREQEVKVGYEELKSANVNEALTLLGQLCVYCIAAYCISRKSITVGQFVACAAYFSTCATYYNALGRKLTDMSGNLVGIHRVEEFMSEEEEQDLPKARNCKLSKGNIRFKQVSFGYGETTVLHNLNLQIEAGDKVAFVGRSGEGKSTLLQLLYRLYEPEEGCISVDDICLTDYSLYSLRSQIAVVQQDNGLLHGSFRKNISLSDDSTNDSRIWEILDGLRLKELVEELPEKLDTLIGSGGRELSGGQKQRIAIARCIYRNPKILLLDEATSALDEETERAVNGFIYGQLPDTTILSVAHRFSTVLAAHNAIVIEQGCVVAMGDHESLMQKNELYQSLYEEYIQSATHAESEGIYE
ncbi:MAG TPA: ABC transporter ATP-binding protein [Lachnospiraceae bacterium]|nr:ABC transporter ATP-binding protein [Lachnospiraceae bacterium]